MVDELVYCDERKLYNPENNKTVVRRTIMKNNNNLPITFDYPIECTTIFRFQFMSRSDGDVDNIENGAIIYRVYAFDRMSMEMFIKQHNFDLTSVNIETMPIEDFDDDEDCFIKPYKFKSNKSSEIFNIFTTNKIVTEAIDSACLELCDTLTFGPAIVRDDIGFIKLINDLIYKLPHVFILDHTLMDSSCEPISDHWDRYIKFNSYGQSLENLDDSYVYESLHNHSIDTEIQPITVEAYASSFAKMIIDSIR